MLNICLLSNNYTYEGAANRAGFSQASSQTQGSVLKLSIKSIIKLLIVNQFVEASQVLLMISSCIIIWLVILLNQYRGQPKNKAAVEKNESLIVAFK